MNKKNRFSMLEVKLEDKASEKPFPPKGTEEIAAPSKNIVKENKIIISNDEFEENLKQHKLREQVKDIRLKKKKIESQISHTKIMAWIKIALGTFIIVLISRKYIFGTSQVRALDNRGSGEMIITKYLLGSNDTILILLIIAFIYLAFFYKKPKDKK